MGTSNHSDEFKRDTVHQITVRGYPVREVSQRFGVSTHSLYKWMKLFGEPASKAHSIDHEAENRRLKRELADDLRDQGEQISENRVARLASLSLAGIVAQVGYKRRPGRYGGRPAIVAENKLEQQFHVSQPDQVGVTDITYIKTHEGWLYLCVAIDLFSRRVVG